MEINKQFVTYEIALKLKEMGFDEYCFGVFFRGKFMTGNVEQYVWNLVHSATTNSDCNSIDIVTAPLWQQVIDWLREVYDIHIEIYLDINDLYEISITNKVLVNYYIDDDSDQGFIDFYKAREQAILKSIEICQQ